MEYVAILAGLATMVTCWVLLVKSMRINGRPMWWRHFAAASWSPFTLTGAALLVGSLLGVTDEQGNSWGFGGIISGLVVLIPVIVAMSVSRGAAKRKQLNSQAADNHPQSAPAAPRPEPSPSSKPKANPNPKSKPSLESAATRELDLPPGALRFTYEDFNGDLSSRTVVNWNEEGEYIKGFCLDRRDTRTFRKERIVTFSDGEHLLQGEAETRAPRKPATRDKPMEILFTGFPKDKRTDLEERAKEEGMIVRMRVTQALDFLCMGPKAAPSKQVEAEHRGATVLDEMAFYDLVESGELR